MSSPRRSLLRPADGPACEASSCSGLFLITSATAAAAPPVDRIDGSGNNLLHPDWGQAGTQYLRLAAPNYADGIKTPVAGPPTRYVSNRIHNDVGQNLFSENGISQSGWTWGGDVCANENIALTGVHTLFAREHNRIVDALPVVLTAQDTFDIARRVVGAEMQFITYNEFLPELGVTLAPYHGYDANVNAGLGNEFAVVGYRAHSMIHGEFEPTVPAGRYAAQLDSFRAQGIEVEEADGQVVLVIPLVVAFGNPDLLQQVGLKEVMQALAGEGQYKNDEQLDNAVRSVLFQVPKPGIPDPRVCGSPVINPDCFTGVVDLGAIDIERGRDHGMPYYSALRAAFGLAPKTSFVSITGESTASFPTNDPEVDLYDPIDDPDILDFVKLFDRNGNPIALGSPEAEEEAVVGIRRTTLAARLKAVYRDVNKIDAFVGMVSEQHVAGTEFGELQLTMWKQQFEALRDGDRFFYLNDPVLTTIKTLYGIDYQHTLAELIRPNTNATVQDHVFEAPA